MARGRGSVRVSITGDERDLTRSVSRADKALNRLGIAGHRSLKGLGGAAQAADSKFGKLAKAASLAGAGYLAIGAARSAVDTTVDLGKATLNLHRNLGLTIRQSSEWAAVAKVRNVETRALNQSFGTLARQSVAAAKGTKSSADAFKTLGISQDELKKLNFNELLFATADGLGKLAGGQDKTNASMRLFGRGWQTIVPVLRGGSKAMEEQLGLARKYGATFSGGTIKSVEDLIKAQREAKFATLGLQVAFGTKLAPALAKVIPAVTNFLNQMRTGKGTGGDFARVLKDIVRVTIDVVKWTVNAIRDLTRWGHAIRDFLFDAARLFRSVWRGIERVVGNVMSAMMHAFAEFIRNTAGRLPVVGGKFRDLADKIDHAARRTNKLGEEIKNLPGRKTIHIDVSAALAGWGHLTTPQNAVGGQQPHGDGWGLEKAVDKVIQRKVQAKAKADPQSILGAFATGGGSAGLMGANANLAPFAALGARFGLSVVSGLRPGSITSSGNVSYHASGRAIDVDAGPASAMLAYAQAMANFFGSRLKELIHSPLGFSIKNGQRVAPYAVADHYDHVHVAMQRGGKLPGGRTGDLNPIWAEDGEFVVNRRAAATFGPALEWMNSRVPRFQKGGKVKDKGRADPPYSPIEVAAMAARAAGFRGQDLINMVAIAGRESTYNPRAHNGNRATGDDSYGLWQINVLPNANPQYGGLARSGKLFDPYVNARVAHEMFTKSGYGPWRGVSYGNASSYLDDAAQAVAAIAGVSGKGGRSTPGGAKFTKGRSSAGPGRTRLGNLYKTKPGNASKIIEALITEGSDRTAFNEAMAALTPGQQDDIAAAFGAVGTWSSILDVALKSGDKASATTAAQNLAGAKSTLTDLQGGSSALGDATRELADLMKQSVANQQEIINYARVQGPQLQNILLAGFSGGIGSKAGFGRSYPSYTGVGGLARY